MAKTLLRRVQYERTGTCVRRHLNAACLFCAAYQLQPREVAGSIARLESSSQRQPMVDERMSYVFGSVDLGITPSFIVHLEKIEANPHKMWTVELYSILSFAALALSIYV